MHSNTLARRIASILAAIANCQKSGNVEWEAKHEETLCRLEREYLPRGSGFDSGTKIDRDSTAEKLVLTTSFHHMNDAGMYDGWTDHTVTVRPSFVFDIDIRVSGRDRNAIKGYVADVFRAALLGEVQP